MKAIIHRWPVLTDSGGPARRREIQRTSKPLETRELDASLAGPNIHVSFGISGWYDFRLSTGRSVTQDMLDWCIDAENLKAWRALRAEERRK